MTFLKSSKWKLAFKVTPFVVGIIILKLITHQSEWEFLTLNTLFGAIISANVFLVGFLISGVLVDYKEAEKLPGELACSLEALTDECYIVYKNKKSKVAKEFIKNIHDLTTSIIKWLHKKEKTEAVLKKISSLNDHLLALEPLTQANFIVRLKNEQNNLRRFITRIHTIRETSFNPAGYAIAEIITVVLCIGLIFTRIDPYYESIFFVAFVSFMLIYMVLLIKDLDNPFGYYEKDNLTEEVSLKPLFDLEKRMLHDDLRNLK
jgi:predicted membrane chloride channel (bestrophin family)